MKRIASRGIAFVIPLLLFYFFTGCSSDSTNSIPPESTSPLPVGSYYYQFEAANLRTLDAASSHYVLWLSMLGDSNYSSIELINPTISNGSIVYSGVIKLPHNPDSILTTIVSIEPLTLTTSPSSPLMTGQFQSSDSQSFLSGADTGGIGDFSNTAGSVIFTTKLTDTSHASDTSRAEQEFYLMKFVNGVPTSSMTNLPSPPVGWLYGLWVYDSSFYPVHKFFYGSFTNPNGPGSDSSNAEFPFPGGYNPAPLTDRGATLELTLEPDFLVAGNKPAGPSPIVLLSLHLRQFIYFDQSIPFQNVWSGTTPTGILKIWR